MDPATVTVQLNPEDMRNFTQFATARVRKLGRTVGLIVVAAVIFTGVYVQKSISPPAPQPTVAPTRPGPPSLSPIHWIAVAFGLSVFVGGRFFLKWATTNPGLYKKSSPGVFDPKTYTVLDEGLLCQYPLGESRDRWPGIVRFVETKDYFFLLVAERRGHVLPKRCFSTSEDTAIFANQIRQHLEKHSPKALGGPAR
jgi:hypothetical protein